MLDKLKGLVATLRNLLQGEPLRVIGYGSIAVVYIVTHVAVMLGFSSAAPGISAIEDAITAATNLIVDFLASFAGGLGFRPAGDSIDAVLLALGALAIAFTEISRHYVYSPKSVATIAAGAQADAGAAPETAPGIFPVA